MQRKDTPSDRTKWAFVKVLDGRNRQVRGLWKRGAAYYARMRVEGARSAVRVRLHDVATVPQAILAMQALRTKLEAGIAPQINQAPTLTQAVDAYNKYHAVTGAKRKTSLAREERCFKHLLKFRPELRLNRMTSKFAHEYAMHRQSAGASGRSVDLEIIALRSVLKAAVRDGNLAVMPALAWKRLAAKPKSVRLLTAEELDATCQAASGQRYGEMFGFYLRLLAYCGGREQETLRLRWDAVDLERRQLRIGRPVMIEDEQKLSKSGDERVVDFNPTLESHLTAMSKRRQPGTEWLFPSPRPRGRDVPLSNFNKALVMAVERAGVKHFGFHHLRHYFISQCVMAGIDYMTIAKWVGHKDGGVLIGKVYGHLDNAHTARQAKKLKL